MQWPFCGSSAAFGTPSGVRVNALTASTISDVRAVHTCAARPFFRHYEMRCADWGSKCTRCDKGHGQATLQGESHHRYTNLRGNNQSKRQCAGHVKLGLWLCVGWVRRAKMGGASRESVRLRCVMTQRETGELKENYATDDPSTSNCPADLSILTCMSLVLSSNDNFNAQTNGAGLLAASATLLSTAATAAESNRLLGISGVAFPDQPSLPSLQLFAHRLSCLKRSDGGRECGRLGGRDRARGGRLGHSVLRERMPGTSDDPNLVKAYSNARQKIAYTACKHACDCAKDSPSLFR